MLGKARQRNEENLIQFSAKDAEKVGDMAPLVPAPGFVQNMHSDKFMVSSHVVL